MSDNNEQDWSNYWQGRASGEALVGVGVEHSEELATFWQGCFDGQDSDIRVLDMACGAGSVLRHADGAGYKNLSGVDISKEAISTLETAIPNAKGIVAPVDNTGLADSSYDMVVSQFGFEYAGSSDQVLAAAGEMARLVAGDGQFAALCHIEGGGIELECSGHLAHIEAVENTGFIDAAKAVFTAAFKVDSQPGQDTMAAYQKTVEQLGGPRGALVAWIENNRAAGEIAALANHLLTGTADMFGRRKAFALSDITGWLDGMNGEINAYRGRMTSMKQAALSGVDAGNILSVFEKNGFKTAPPEKLYMGGEDIPAAWILRAQR